MLLLFTRRRAGAPPLPPAPVVPLLGVVRTRETAAPFVVTLDRASPVIRSTDFAAPAILTTDTVRVRRG